jgi:hypothetical protein
MIHNGYTFVNGTGACISTLSNVLITISETNEETIIAVAYKGINTIIMIEKDTQIQATEIKEYRQYPEEIRLEIQQVINLYHLGTIKDSECS